MGTEQETVKILVDKIATLAEKLRPEQRRFAELYLSAGDALAAMKETRPDLPDAAQHAAAMLRDPGVREYIRSANALAAVSVQDHDAALRLLARERDRSRMGDLSNKYVVMGESVGGDWWATADGDTNDALRAAVFDEAGAEKAADRTGYRPVPLADVLRGDPGTLAEELRRLVEVGAERAFLVEDVGFTPEQAADSTSGDIDRNGAASMLPGIIEALEQAGATGLTDDEVIGAGIAATGHPAAMTAVEKFAVPTMLKLLQRAREAEAKVQALAERLAGTVVDRDLKPENPWPLWCAFETHPEAELPFRGPFAEQAQAEDEVADLNATGCDAVVRRCRRIRASECVRPKWLVDSMVDRIELDPGEGKTGETGVYMLGAGEETWVRRRKGADLGVLDDLLEVDAFEIEPEGAAS